MALPVDSPHCRDDVPHNLNFKKNELYCSFAALPILGNRLTPTDYVHRTPSYTRLAQQKAADEIISMQRAKL